MSKMDDERAAGFEEGYLAAIRDLRSRVEGEMHKLQNAEPEMGVFYLICNGLRNGAEKLAADFELQGVKMLANRRSRSGEGK